MCSSDRGGAAELWSVPLRPGARNHAQVWLPFTADGSMLARQRHGPEGAGFEPGQAGLGTYVPERGAV